MKHREIRRRWPARRLFIGFLALLGLMSMLAGPAQARKYSGATNSSPITLSADGKYLWTVNPGADNVSVIYAKTNKVIAKIKVGDEPQSVAVDPNNRYAYVANAATGSVTVIRITKAKGSKLKAKADTRAGNKGQIVTGSEPWNVVVSPSGKRVYVANSAQDTITVIDGTKPRKSGRIGDINIKKSECNDPDRNRHFQPRGLAVSKDSKRLLVTSFFSWTLPGGVQGSDVGRAGVVCRIGLSSKSKKISKYRVKAKISVGPQVTGFTVDSTGDGVPDPTSAFPNELQSIVIHGSQAYLPNIAASPTGPLRFNVDTQAFVNVLNGASSGNTRDAGAAKFINLHLGARQPEPNKKKLFFANAWAIGFTKRGAGAAYVVSAGSDLLVKVNVDGSGKLTNTVDADTTRYIDLNDPANPATAGNNAGKNPQGIAINKKGTRAYVQNFVSRNVSVVDLTTDSVTKVIRTASLPAPGTPDEVVAVGAELFFSSRGLFNKVAGQTTSNQERMSSEGWQSCASCHFKGLTDSVVWQFNSGPRKSVPLNATFNPRSRNEQRILNYSAVFDEVDDFEANIRNISGPGPLAAPGLPCSAPPPATSTLDPNHGILIGDNGNPNLAPCVLNAFAKPNAGRPQMTVTLPGSSAQVPALTALREWVRFAVRTPRGPSTTTSVGNHLSKNDVSRGRTLFAQAGCSACHVGGKWTISTKDFNSPPAGTELFTETTPPAQFGAPIGLQYLNRFLRNIGSFNLGVKNGPNPLGANVGAIEKATQALTAGVAGPAPDALGIDYNGDGRGNGFNVASLLGIDASPPFYHNGACESLDCVVGNVKHRTVNGTRADGLPNSKDRALVVKFLKSIDARTKP